MTKKEKEKLFISIRTKLYNEEELIEIINFARASLTSIRDEFQFVKDIVSIQKISEEVKNLLSKKFPSISGDSFRIFAHCNMSLNREILLNELIKEGYIIKNNILYFYGYRLDTYDECFKMMYGTYTTVSSSRVKRECSSLNRFRVNIEDISTVEVTEGDRSAQINVFDPNKCVTILPYRDVL